MLVKFVEKIAPKMETIVKQNQEQLEKLRHDLSLKPGDFQELLEKSASMKKGDESSSSSSSIQTVPSETGSSSSDKTLKKQLDFEAE